MMSSVENDIQNLECPGCKKPIKVSYYEIISRKEAKCTRCNSLYKFNSTELSNLRSSIKNVETANKKLEELFYKIVSKAEKKIAKTH